MEDLYMGYFIAGISLLLFRFNNFSSSIYLLTCKIYIQDIYCLDKVIDIWNFILICCWFILNKFCKQIFCFGGYEFYIMYSDVRWNGIENSTRHGFQNVFQGFPHQEQIQLGQGEIIKKK
eukprot:TRINITY_DN2583_c0_g2_i9.p5 TRINITY_DN2583_c0_g2~~TRINITY_DN2583_c0_g2_i9.p5  ORF type:complete len:120 (-),score=0.72 TRINITY_DN2583_c0_g2_i9:43-402(-)